MKSNPRICVVGSAMFDQVIRSPRLPSPGETAIGTRYETGFGGKGANQAVMAARLGLDVTLVAKLGRDAIGQATLAQLGVEGIRPDFIFWDEQVASGVASIWVEESTGQNSILIAPGANQTLTFAEVRRAESAIADSAVVISQLETPMTCAAEAFRIARASGRGRTLLNPAPGSPLSAELWALTDILVPNDTEATALSGLPVGNDAEAARAARELPRRGPGTVVITLRSRGVLTVCA